MKQSHEFPRQTIIKWTITWSAVNYHLWWIRYGWHVIPHSLFSQFFLLIDHLHIGRLIQPYTPQEFKPTPPRKMLTCLKIHCLAHNFLSHGTSHDHTSIQDFHTTSPNGKNAYKLILQQKNTPCTPLDGAVTTRCQIVLFKQWPWMLGNWLLLSNSNLQCILACIYHCK